MIIHLKRFSYGEYETEGVLVVGGTHLATIEQPWTPNPNGAKGGKPFESCVPDGMYRLTSYTRNSGEEAFIFWNPELGVHRLPTDHDEHFGRDLCLIHKGNWAHDVQGCIAVGKRRRAMDSKQTPGMDQAVADSALAMGWLRGKLGETQHILSITNDTGASDA